MFDANAQDPALVDVLVHREAQDRVNDVLRQHRDKYANRSDGKVVGAVLVGSEHARVQRHQEEAEDLSSEVSESQKTDVLGKGAIARH